MQYLFYDTELCGLDKNALNYESRNKIIENRRKKILFQ